MLSGRVAYLFIRRIHRCVPPTLKEPHLLILQTTASTPPQRLRQRWLWIERPLPHRIFGGLTVMLFSPLAIAPSGQRLPNTFPRISAWALGGAQSSWSRHQIPVRFRARRDKPSAAHSIASLRDH